MMRLDQALVGLALAESRSRAQLMIKNGLVCVNGKAVLKSSFAVCESDNIECKEDLLCPYVSRGGIKLKGAIDAFNVDVSGKICIDIGASSGGFTDCLLKCGASKVYCVDSGHSQLHHSLLSDERVINFENVNARYIGNDMISEPIDIAVMDVSFISQTKIYDSLSKLIKDGGIFISLIKPQFEVGRSAVGKGGIVKDDKKRNEAVKNVIEIAKCYGFENKGLINSPIKGGDGNVEFLAIFEYKKALQEETN